MLLIIICCFLRKGLRESKVAARANNNPPAGRQVQIAKQLPIVFAPVGVPPLLIKKPMMNQRTPPSFGVITNEVIIGK